MQITLGLLLLIMIEAMAVWCVWRAISSARTSQGAVGWIVFLLMAPFVGVPLFLFLGHHKFKKYLIARRDSIEVVEGVQVFKEIHAPATPPRIGVEPFEAIAEMPVVRGNNMEILIDGEATFDTIMGAIDLAEHYALIQFYIVRDDTLGRALKDRMIAAAQRGVIVRFKVDAVGSYNLPTAYMDELRQAGVQVVNPKLARGPKNRFQLNFRNHRKTVIIDGKVGFIGGFNVGDEYMGRDPKFGPWRDTHVRFTGPMVSQLQLVFAEDWHWGTDEALIEELDWVPEHDPVDMTGLIVPTGPADEMETGALFFFSAISAAQHRVWIASPYFVPDTDVLTALKHAALRGVEVRLLVPDVIDHKTPWLAAFAYFDEVRTAGVEIWRYTEGFMHQKVVLVDDDFAAIGTTNLDNRSFRLNFEAMAAFFDKRAAAQTETMLEADFARSYRLDAWLADQPRHVRYGSPVARLFSPLL
ncbi:MAG: cardiolipin synthase [Rhodobacteraceae bacterium]|nr:cardiolipin synthase [Paracoccaceae bacterium]